MSASRASSSAARRPRASSREYDASSGGSTSGTVRDYGAAVTVSALCERRPLASSGLRPEPHHGDSLLGERGPTPPLALSPDPAETCPLSQARGIPTADRADIARPLRFVAVRHCQRPSSIPILVLRSEPWRGYPAVRSGHHPKRHSDVFALVTCPVCQIALSPWSGRVQRWSRIGGFVRPGVLGLAGVDPLGVDAFGLDSLAAGLVSGFGRLLGGP